MSKPIKNQFEMIDICRKATSYFVGSFMLEMIKRRNEWQNSATKTRFIESFHQSYFAWDETCSDDGFGGEAGVVIGMVENV